MPVLRQLLILLVTAGAVVGGWVWYSERDSSNAAQENGRGARVLEILAAPVERALVRSIVEAVGTTRASDSIDVVPTVSGRIAEIHFTAGQEVETGDLLISLDRATEQAAVAEAQALLEDARGQLERAKQLAERQTVSKARVDELTAQYLAAKARLDGANSRLADRTVRAPFAGTVGLRNVSVGAWVDDETVITTLDALDTLEIEFSVPEIYFSLVRPGASIVGTSPTFKGRTFEGIVESVDSRIDTVTRSFRVRAVIENPERLLPAGMFMTVSMVLDEHEGLVVPEEAILTEGRATYVFLIRDGIARQVRVELGTRTYGQVEVIDGLSEGDRVAISGLQRLRDGMAVTIRPADGDAPTS